MGKKSKAEKEEKTRESFGWQPNPLHKKTHQANTRKLDPTSNAASRHLCLSVSITSLASVIPRPRWRAMCARESNQQARCASGRKWRLTSRKCSSGVAAGIGEPRIHRPFRYPISLAYFRYFKHFLANTTY